MASTFTGNVELEKPGIGEQSGVWGYSLNTNFDKIDAAVGRVLTLNAAGNPILSTSQTAVASFDSAIIRLTGDISGLATRTLTFPTGKQKRYDIDTYGVSFGANKIVLKVAGETIGVTITSVTDKVISVYTDGVSVRSKQQNVSPFIIDEIRMYAPVGGLVSANLPNGWYVANGNNGTIDLRDRFIKGHPNPAIYPTSAIGGSANTNINIASVSVAGSIGMTAITTAQMPSHSHKIIADAEINSGGEVANVSPNGYLPKLGTRGDGDDKGWSFVDTTTSATLGQTSKIGSGQGHTHTLNISTGSFAASVAINPKHYALIFIQYKGA